MPQGCSPGAFLLVRARRVAGQGGGGGDPGAGRDGDRRGRGAVRPRRGHRGRGRWARPAARDHPRVPGPGVRVALPAEGAARVPGPRREGGRVRRRDRRRGGSGNESGDGIVWTTRWRTSRTTGPAPAWRGWRSDDDQGPHLRHQHGVGDRRGRARDVHAGGLRVPRGRPDEDEERRSHRGQERADLRAGVDRLLPRRIRDGVRRRGQRLRGRLRLLSVDRRAAAIGTRRSRGSPQIPAAAGYIFEVVFCGVSLAIVWGAMAERTKLWVYFVFGASSRSSTRSSRTGSGARRMAVLQGDAGLRGLDRRALPGRAGGLAGALLLGPRIGKFGADGSRTRSPATTWPSSRSA